MSPVLQLLVGALFCFVAFTAVWFVQLRTRNAGIVDVCWPSSIALMALFYALSSSGDPDRRLGAAALAAFWGARLALYLYITRIHGQPEEGRYRQLRKEWGAVQDRKLFAFFQMQAAAALFFSLPFLLIAHHGAAPWTMIESVGLGLWLIAFSGEVLADWQLTVFKSNPRNRGRTCMAGLWRYSRHPNYFFEFLIWIALAVMALPAPWGALALACPAVMLYFIFRVTGIPATEAQALRTRGEEYRRYVRTTSAFVPWFPRHLPPGELQP